MNLELKKAIVNFMLENSKEFQLLNTTKEIFRQYIYTAEGNFCIGGQEVSEFINNFYKLI